MPPAKSRKVSKEPPAKSRKASKKPPAKSRKESKEVEPEPEPEVEDIGTEPTGAVEPLPYFGTDFDVFGLVRRLSTGDILIPSFDPMDNDSEIPGFQRKFVWTKGQKNRFVESLLLGYPVPGIFLVQQTDKKLLVLDGQQRLKTLQLYYDNEFALEDVVEEYNKKRYVDLDDESRRTIDNTFIHATVVKHDQISKGADETVFQIFERLNTGGTNLYPHEIRVALYGGSLVELVRDLNSNENWRKLYGPRSARLKDQELILRFIALYYEANTYQRPLRSFLNDFLRRHRNMQGLSAAEIRRIFAAVCKILQDSIGPGAIREKRAVNAAMVDAVMVGMARRIVAIKAKPNDAKVQHAHALLLKDSEFLRAIGRATADEERVRLRLEKATEHFARC